MSKLRSEFSDCPAEWVSKIDGTPFEEGEAPPPMRVQFESVFKGRQIVALYIVINGDRAACRGQDTFGQPAWIPMTDQYCNIVDDIYRPAGPLH